MSQYVNLEKNRFKHFETILLGLYKFEILISSCPATPFHYEITFKSHNAFCICIYLCDINISNSYTSFLGGFAMLSLFPHFYLNLNVLDVFLVNIIQLYCVILPSMNLCQFLIYLVINLSSHPVISTCLTFSFSLLS